jgi:hypothetical protein
MASDDEPAIAVNLRKFMDISQLIGMCSYQFQFIPLAPGGKEHGKPRQAQAFPETTAAVDGEKWANSMAMMKDSEAMCRLMCKHRCTVALAL